MNLLTNILKADKKFLSIYLTAGYPNLQDTLPLVLSLEKAGVDFIELGMPYSDPLADGETIQSTCIVALRNGMTLPVYFELAKEIRRHSNIPLVYMGHYNQLIRYGIDAFYQSCSESGINALIIPDLPIHEYETLHQETLQKHNLKIIFLITPNTSQERIEKIDSLANGFIYVVSSNSTTGGEKQFGEGKSFFERIDKITTENKKIMGFGIHDLDTYTMAISHADGAIIGSAFLKAISKGDPIESATKFINKLRPTQP